MRIGSLFSGYGGLDMAASAALGGTVAWHAEIDPAACLVLDHRYPDVPNLGDVTGVDWPAAEPVDVVTAGWPCQPWSFAGRRKGIEDDRALWPAVAAAVRVLRPGLVVLENVPGVIPAGELARASADLAASGYVGSWACLLASDVGAPHRRERVFIVARPAADAHDVGREGAVSEPRRHDGGGGPRPVPDTVGERWDRRAHQPQRGAEGRAAAAGDREDAATDAGRARLREHAGAAPVQEARPGGRDVAAGDGGARSDTDWGPYLSAVRRWEHVLGRAAPAPTEPGRSGKPRLSPRFVEWLMGLPDGWLTAVPGVSRNDALRLLGNGVVPRQGAAALQLLLPREAVR